MRLVGLMSFYDEHPDWLARSLRSYHDVIGLDAAVCLDGPYALYPHQGRERSPDHNYDALSNVAQQIGVTIHIDTGRIWQGNEVEKRTALFRLGEQHTTESDRYVVIDADEDVWPTLGVHDPPRTQLEEQAHRGSVGITMVTVGDTGLIDPNDPKAVLPKIFPAVRGLHCHGTHYTYRTPQGRDLWGPGRMTPDYTLRGVEIHHWTRHRNLPRQKSSRAYYQARAEHNIEPKP